MRLLLLAASSILLSADTYQAFPPSSFRSRSTSLSRASIPLRSFEAIDVFTSVAVSNNLRYNIYRCPTTIYSSTATSKEGASGDEDKRNYIRPYLKQLFLLCRPINFPIVLLFHVLGVHQAVEFWKITFQPTSSSPMLSSVLKEPSMIMVLLSLMLVTATSMITNDYYDARNGVDVVAEIDENKHVSDKYGHYHPLVKGKVPFTVAKTFDSYLYAILLLSSAFVPGTISRLMVIGGAITTYLYTVHLKPRTWIKNLSCAALVALSPITSGLAAWQVLQDGTTIVRNASSVPYALFLRSPLSYLVMALFAGIMSREILMDITDCEGDARAGIQTVPVKYGKEMASKVAMAWSILAAVAACGESLVKWVPTGISRIMSISSGADSVSLSIISPTARKLVLSVMGSGFIAQKTYEVYKTKGDDSILAEKAVRDYLLGVLLVLASFL